MTQPVAPQKRAYGGQTADERQEARRRRLIESGMELFGTVGYRSSSIRAVLRESGLGERYFYESFDSLEDLLIAVSVEVQAIVKDAILEALAGIDEEPTIVEMCRVSLLALATTLTADPRYLRIAVVESIGISERVTDTRNELVNEFADLIVSSTLEFGSINPVSARIFALALVGSANELLVRWTAGEVSVDMPTLVEHLLILFWGTLEHAETFDLVEMYGLEVES